MSELLGASDTVASRGDAAAPTTSAVATQRNARRRAFIQPELIVCAVVLLGFVLMAVWPGLFTAQDPLLAVPADRFLPPSIDHLFGTDQIGRDMFSRVVHGAGLSLRAGLLAVLVAVLVGGFVGLLAGYLGGWVDTVVGRVLDAMLAIPGLLLALALVAVFGSSSLTVAVAIGVANIPVFARVMRAESLRVRTSLYVEAARASGARPGAVLGFHVLPNSVDPVVGLAVLEFGQAMLAVGALSYLGFGEAPPTPEWGALIAGGQAYLSTAWWVSVLPGAVLAIVVLFVNRTAHLYQKRA